MPVVSFAVCFGEGKFPPAESLQKHISKNTMAGGYDLYKDIYMCYKIGTKVHPAWYPVADSSQNKCPGQMEER